MNILTDQLPASVTIHNTEYQVETDFRVCLRTILAFEDDALTQQEKYIILLNNLYPVIPKDTQYGVIEAMRFLNGGKDDEEVNAPRVYSFAKDSNFIFAAFRQTHGIDLQTVDLHWYEFLALFMDLGSETTFCNLVSLRSRIKKGRATKEEKQAARELGEMFDVPEIDDRTLEEKEAERKFFELIEQGQRNRESNNGS